MLKLINLIMSARHCLFFKSPDSGPYAMKKRKERTARKERICRLGRKGQQGKDGEERTVRKG